MQLIKMVIKLTRVSIFILLLLTLIHTAFAGCRKKDIMSIIGGESYTINHMTVAHVYMGMPGNQSPYLVVAGKLTDSDTSKSKGFMYVLQYNVCQVVNEMYNFTREQPTVNQGWHAVVATSNPSQVFLIGYNEDSDSDWHEVVVRFDVNGDFSAINPLQLMSQSTQFDETQTSLLLSQSVSGSVLTIVSAKQLRFYDYSDSSLQILQSISSTWITAAFSTDLIFTASINSGKTQIEAYSRSGDFSSAVFSKEFGQDHGNSGVARMAAFQTGTNAAVVMALGKHTGSSPGLFLNCLTIDTSTNPATVSLAVYKTSTLLKCLRVEVTSLSLANIYAIDNMQRLRRFIVKVTDGSVTESSISAVIPYYNAYTEELPSSSVVLDQVSWDQYILGVSSSLTLEGKTFAFQEPIGWLMGLTKNRITALMQADSTPAEFTAIASAIQDCSSPSSYSQVVVSAPNNAASSWTQTNFDKKNQWIEQLQNDACNEISIDAERSSSCYYYSFVANYTNITNTNNPAIPKLTSACPTKEVFRPRIKSDYTAPDQNMRATCFPYIIEEIDEQIPTDMKGKPMLKLVNNDYIQWVDSVNTDVLGKKWLYMLREFTDEGRSKKYNLGGTDLGDFEAFKVKNSVFKMLTNKFWSRQVYDLNKSPGRAVNLAITCWSKVCPDFIHYNSNNFTIWTDFAASNMKFKNGTYLYKIDYYDTQSQDLFEQTYTLVVKNPKVSGKVGINITEPFDIWYEKNKATLKWYSPPVPNSTSLHSAEAMEVQVKELDKNYNAIVDSITSAGIAFSEIKSWSRREIEQAFVEAYQRAEKKTVPIKVTATFSEVGLLTLTFNNPVSFPSYLIQEAMASKNLQMTQSQPDIRKHAEIENKMEETQRKSRRLKNEVDLFFVKADYLKNQMIPSAEVESQPDVDLYVSKEFDETGEDFFDPEPVEDTEKIEENAQLSTKPQLNDQLNKIDITAEKTTAFLPESTESPVEDDQPELVTTKFADTSGEQNEDYTDEDQQSQEKFEFAMMDFIDLTKEDQQVNVVQDGPQSCNPLQHWDAPTKQCKQLQIYFGKFNDLFSISMRSTAPPAEEETIHTRRQLLEMTQQIVNITENQISIQFKFANPLELSPDDNFDITCNFSEFEKGLPSNFKITRQAIRQVIPGNAVKTVAAVGQASQAATITTVVGSVIMQTLVSGCLAQIWGMINGMNFILHIPTLNIQFPSNAFMVIQKILIVATFDIPYLNLATISAVYKLPVDDAILVEQDQSNIKASFEVLGYGSAYMSNNLGSMYLFMLMTINCLFWSTVLYSFNHPILVRINEKIKSYLMWNFVIRLIIEGYMELCFSVYFQLKYTKYSFDYLGSMTDYIMGCFLAMLIIIAPLFVAIFYYRNFAKFEDEEFVKTYGSVYEGLKTTDRSVIVYTIYFMIRRAAFASISVFVYRHVMVQLGLATVITLLSACYLLQFKPFAEPLLNRLEMVNEVTTLFLISVTYTFTDLFKSVKFKYNIGFVFNVGFASCIATHLFFLFEDLGKTALKRLKVWLKKRKDKKINQRKPIEVDVIEEIKPKQVAGLDVIEEEPEPSDSESNSNNNPEPSEVEMDSDQRLDGTLLPAGEISAVYSRTDPKTAEHEEAQKAWDETQVVQNEAINVAEEDAAQGNNLVLKIDELFQSNKTELHNSKVEEKNPKENQSNNSVIEEEGSNLILVKHRRQFKLFGQAKTRVDTQKSWQNLQ